MPAHRSFHPILRDNARDRVAAFPRAFSLLELVLCLLIISTLAAIAVPRFAGAASRTRAVTAATAVAAEINRVRHEADAASTSRTIAFRKSASQFQVLGERGNLLRTVELPEPAMTQIIGAEFGTDDSVIFNGFGTPDSSGFVDVVAGGYSCRVVLGAPTGACTIGAPTIYEKAGGR